MKRYLPPIGLIVLTLGMLVIVAFFAAPYIPTLRDFDQTFYPAIRYTLAGENPYTAHYEETDQGAPPDFFSPFWLLIILFPFGLFPLAMARALWVIFLIGVTVGAVGLLRPWGLTGLKPLFLVAIPWSLIGILFGQVTAIVLLGVIFTIREVQKPDRSHASALKLLLGLLLMGIKPQLMVFLAVPLLMQMVWRRDRRLIPLCVAGSVILTIALLITPPWLVGRAVAVQQIAPHWKATLERELALWQWPLWLAHFVRLLVVGVMGLWVWRERTLSPTWWSVWLVTTLIITPYTRAYDGVLMLPLLGQMAVFWRWHLLVWVVVMGVYVLLPYGELGSVVAPLTAWLLAIPWKRLITQV
jgi:hypothetical protein